MEPHVATVISTRQLGDGVSLITFTTSPHLSYTAGQYISVYREGSRTKEGKAYSLCSAPHEAQMVLVVKNIGEFSGMLCALNPGDTFTCSDGYGNLNPRTTAPLICLTSGIGVTPIWSIIKDELKRCPQRPVALLCSHRTIDSIPVRRAIARSTLSHPNFTCTYYITREPIRPHRTMIPRRIDLGKDLPTQYENPVYLLCGSADFVQAMWHGLLEKGVSPRRISTESFFE